jgi:hypothetical protein
LSYFIIARANNSLLGLTICLTLHNTIKSRLYNRNPLLIIKSHISFILHQHLFH